MAVVKEGDDLLLEASEDFFVMILGGSAVGERFIFWNFVSSSAQKLENAKAEWRNGPSKDNSSFHPVPDDCLEYIPLP